MSGLRLVNPVEKVAGPSAKNKKEKQGFYQLLLDRVERFSSMALQVLRDGDSDAIHHMRVYSRRVQSALEVLPKELDVRTRPLRRQLSRIRRSLNKVRDFDVFLKIVKKRPATAKNKEAYDLLCDHFSKERERVLERMRERLENLGVREFPSKFISAITDPDSSLIVDGTSLRVELASVARDDKAFERAIENIEEHWRTVRGFISNASTFSESERLHALRIAIKRLRYIVELAAQMSDVRARTAISRLKSLQASIGEWHDLEVLETRIIKIIARPDFIANELDNCRVLHNLIAQLRRRKLRVLVKIKAELLSDELPATIDGLMDQLKPYSDSTDNAGVIQAAALTE
ncbi:MAG TPA: CHAD domain-containing protein [Blastocatellia bacterium]|nr:CHAD domain-containing protein [Blastocatellia bacterium]